MLCTVPWIYMHSKLYTTPDMPCLQVCLFVLEVACVYVLRSAVVLHVRDNMETIWRNRDMGLV